MECAPIGTVSTPFATSDEAPRQGAFGDAVGTVHLNEVYVPGMEGFREGADVVVVWFAHDADRSLLQVDRDGPRGVFTTRSPSRPNPICLTTCTVLGVEGSAIRLRGVDMVDGTPVLDLKPPIDPSDGDAEEP